MIRLYDLKEGTKFRYGGDEYELYEMHGDNANCRIRYTNSYKDIPSDTEVSVICDEKKISDQSIKADNGKPKLTLVPHQIIFDIARIREYGVNKYGDSENWKAVDVDRYRDAAFRHFMAYLDDPDGRDSESGLPHLWHLACNIAFLCELEKKPLLFTEECKALSAINVTELAREQLINNLKRDFDGGILEAIKDEVYHEDLKKEEK